MEATSASKGWRTGRLRRENSGTTDQWTWSPGFFKDRRTERVAEHHDREEDFPS